MDKPMYIPEKDELIQHICKLMRKHRIRQREIEALSGIPQSTISHTIGKNKKRRPRELTYEEARKMYNAILHIMSPFGKEPISEIATKSDKVDIKGTVDSEAKVSEVAELMTKYGFTQLIVKNNGLVEGVITDSILLNELLSPKDVSRDWLKELREKSIKSLIEKSSIIPEHSTQTEVAQALTYHYAVIIDEGKMKYGIATINDFMQLLWEK
jgi:predicted transcriptional regulator